MISSIHITAFSWLLCFSALVSGQTVGQILQQTPTCAVSSTEDTLLFINMLQPADSRRTRSRVSSMSFRMLAASPALTRSTHASARMSHCSRLCQVVHGCHVKFLTRSVSCLPAVKPASLALADAILFSQWARMVWVRYVAVLLCLWNHERRSSGSWLSWR